jgi:ABC-type sugar transport system permease subunit
MHATPEVVPAGTIRHRLRQAGRAPKLWFVAAVLVPLLAWYGIFSLWALVQGVKLAFTTYHLINPALNRFVGLRNFQSLANDSLFFISLGNSALWGILGNFVGVPLCLGVALCLINVKRGRNLYQTLIFIPVVLSLVSVIVLVRYLLDDTNGPVNAILTQLHLPTSTFLDSTHTALPTLVGFAIWKGWGVTIVILTAGLLNIPAELLDAARVDGTTAWQRFWHVTLPLLQPTLNFVIIIGVIGSLQTYTEPKVMTNGGPETATYLLNMYIYDVGITNLQFGQASAAALVEFAITLFLTLGVLRLLRLRWSY